VGPELRALGFEKPEQLGALFIADAAVLADLTRGVAPLTDDQPKRLSARRPDHPEQTFAPWMDTDLAAAKFADSILIRRLWPESLREATRPWFAMQAIINGHHLRETASTSRFERVHRVLAESDLRTLPLWLMFSDEFEQRIVERAAARGVDDWQIPYHRGARAMADRDYAEAARLFEEARGKKGALGEVDDWRMLALCLAGRSSEAEALGRRIADSPRASSERPANWRYLERKFGIEPSG
jgi:hypothetical protein